MKRSFNSESSAKDARIKEFMRAVNEANNGFDKYDYITNLDRFRHRESGDLVKERALLNQFRRDISDRMRVEEALYTGVMGIRQYAALTFVPGGAENVVANGQVALNTWSPPGILAIEGDPALFLDLVDLIFDGDAIAIDFFLDAIASLVQKPGTKWAFMVLLIGAQGVGKSVLCEMVAELVGRKNTAFPTVEAMKGQFTGWMLNAHLVVCHELERVSRDVATRIKHWVTSESLLINAKNVPEFYIRNYANILACSNHDDIAQLDEDDRRMFTWVSQAQKREPEYYARVCQWYFQGQGRGIVLKYLLTRDIARFNPHAAPPTTRGRELLIANSRSEADNFLRDALESFAPPFARDLCTASEVLKYLRVHQIRCTDAEVRGFLRQSGAISLGQCRVKGERPNLWAVRHHDRWEAASHDDIANEYVSVFDQRVELPDRAPANPLRLAPMPVRKVPRTDL